jgi:hypothetical protein
MRTLYKTVLKALGGGAILVGSFFITLRAIDYYTERANRPAPIITVQEATYGSNCGRRIGRGNVTPFFSKACDGRSSCDVTISVEQLGDPAPGCGKDFVIRFLCNQEHPGKSEYQKGEANGSTLHLNCQG